MKTTNKMNILMIGAIAILLFACTFFATLFFLTAHQLEALTPPDGYALCMVKNPGEGDMSNVAPVVAKTGENVNEVTEPDDSITEETVEVTEETVDETVAEDAVGDESVLDETEVSDAVPQINNTHCNDVDLILQESYAGVPFGNYGTVGTNGSAITAVSMVVNFLEDTDVYSPVALADMFGSYATYDEASDELFTAVSDMLGIDMPYHTNSWKEVKASLMDGSVVIAKYNNSNPFTNDKHFVVIKGADFVGDEMRYFANDTTLNSYYKEGLYEGFANGFGENIFASCNSFWIYNWDEEYGLVNMAYLDSYNAACAYEDAQVVVGDIVVSIEEINHELAEAHTTVYYANSALDAIEDPATAHAIECYQELENAKSVVRELQAELDLMEDQLVEAKRNAELLRSTYESAAAYAEEMRILYEGA